MGTNQLVKRLLAAIYNIPLPTINRPTELADSDLTKLIQATKSLLYKIGIYIDDTAAITIPQLRAKIRKLVRKYGIKWVIIDYLQLMKGDKNKGGNREQEISQISRDLKALAKEFDIPIIALSQLNRIADDEEPTLTNLRESGAIEQDADLIFFLWKLSDALIKEDSANENRRFLGCAKHRNGDTFTELLDFLKNTQVFRDIEPVNVFSQPVADNPTAGISRDYRDITESKKAENHFKQSDWTNENI